MNLGNVFLIVLGVMIIFSCFAFAEVLPKSNVTHVRYNSSNNLILAPEKFSFIDRNNSNKTYTYSQSVLNESKKNRIGTKCTNVVVGQCQ